MADDLLTRARDRARQYRGCLAADLRRPALTVPLVSWDDLRHGCADDLDALADEVARLRAELAAERGEPEGALEGWEWSTGQWCLIGSHGDSIAHVDRDLELGWTWTVFDRACEVVAHFDSRSARAAMRAAEAAARDAGLLPAPTTRPTPWQDEPGGGVCRCLHPDGPVCGDCPEDAAMGGEVERGD